jgi:hypothetical protein
MLVGLVLEARSASVTADDEIGVKRGDRFTRELFDAGIRSARTELA